MSARPRVVLVAPSVAHDDVPHAGGRYLLSLYRFLEDAAELTVIAPGTRANHEAVELPGAPACPVHLLGLEPASTLRGKAVNRASLQADARLRTLDPGMPFIPLRVGIARSDEARKAIREADVIDLQWSDVIRLVRVMRRLNPSAVITGTFHDVMSQMYDRQPPRRAGEGVYWRALAARSRRQEKSMVRQLDTVVSFSEKDMVLLGEPPRAVVVAPPLSTGCEPRHRPSVTGPVVVVAYLTRWENDQAARWVLEEVWPRVQATMPDARLRMVGTGASADVVSLAAGTDSVELAGFVEDLRSEYVAASVCLVPVRHGAGVKFKTIEGLLHGVPVVTTSVGAEGIGDAPLFARLDDTAQGLADGVLAVLRDPDAHQRAADVVQDWARDRYGLGAFGDSIRDTWRRA